MQQLLVRDLGVDSYTRPGKRAVLTQHDDAALVCNVSLHEILLQAGIVSHCLSFPCRHMAIIDPTGPNAPRHPRGR